MANTYKNIVITPNRDTAANVVPEIDFQGGDATTNTDIFLRVYTASNGTLSFEGSAGQLFSITNNLTGSIFSVNDVSGIPSIDVDASGLVELAPYGGNVVIGRLTDSTAGSGVRLDVGGAINASAILINGAALSAADTTARVTANLAFVHANGAFAKANAALANTAGITTAGALIVPGTLTTTGSLTANAGGPGLQMRGGTTADHVYIEYYPRSATAGRGGYMGFASAATNTFTLMNETTTGSIQIGTAGVVEMTILASGDMGLNRTDPGYALDVVGVANASNVLVNQRMVLTTQNYNSYAPTLTGTGASGTWGINITGSAGSATTATTATNLSGGTVSGTTGTFTGNVTVSSGNISGAGLILSDDGDIVDLNDGFASMRFSNGVRIYSTKGGGTVAITLAQSGTITASSYVVSGGATIGQTISSGFRVTAYNNGTGSGTVTPNPLNGNYQYITNNGAFTLAAPANDCAIDLLIINGSTPGSVTFSGYQVGVTGGSLTLTAGHDFIISIRRINGLSTYSIYAMQ